MAEEWFQKGFIDEVKNLRRPGSGGGTQSDWNASDESDPAYIKNRICYDESTTEEVTYSGKIINNSSQKHDLIPFVLGETVELDVTAGMKINFAPATVTMIDDVLAAEFFQDTDKDKQAVLYTFYETSMKINSGYLSAANPSAYKIIRHVPTTKTKTIDPKYLPIVGGYDVETEKAVTFTTGEKVNMFSDSSKYFSYRKVSFEGTSLEGRLPTKEELATATNFVGTDMGSFTESPFYINDFGDGNFELSHYSSAWSSSNYSEAPTIIVINNAGTVADGKISLDPGCYTIAISLSSQTILSIDSFDLMLPSTTPKKIPAEYLVPETDYLKMAFRAYITYEGGSFKGCSLTYDEITKMLDSGRPGLAHVNYVGNDFISQFDAIYNGEEYDSDSESFRYVFCSTAYINGKLRLFKLSIDKDNILRKEVLSVNGSSRLDVTLNYDADNAEWTCSNTYDELKSAIDAGAIVTGKAIYNQLSTADIIYAASDDDYVYLGITGLLLSSGIISCETYFKIGKLEDSGLNEIQLLNNELVATQPTFLLDIIGLLYDADTGDFSYSTNDELGIFRPYLEERLMYNYDTSIRIYLITAPPGYEDAISKFYTASFVEDGALILTSYDTTAAIVLKESDTESNKFVYSMKRIIPKEFYLSSSTENSTKQFKITVDDTGTLTATEVTS